MRCMPWVLTAANAALPFPMMDLPPRSRRRASRRARSSPQIATTPEICAASFPRRGSSGWSGRLTRRQSVPRTSHRRSPWCGAKGRRSGCPRTPRASSPGLPATSPSRPNAWSFPGSLIRRVRRSESGFGRSWSPIPSNKIASKSVSWLSRRDARWSTNPCKWQSLTDKPLISAQCKLILLCVIDLVILH